MKSLWRSSRILTACALFATALVGITISSPQSAQAASYGTLTAQHSGKCLDVFGASVADGTQIVQWPCNGGDNQLFQRQQVAGGVMLRALHSDKCITIRNAGLTNGTLAEQQPCVESSNQVFTIVSERFYRANHSSKCLNVNGATQNNGEVVHQWTCLDQPNVRFDFNFVREVGDPDPDPQPDPDPIPDEGLVEVRVEASALVSERTEVLEAGVVGQNLQNDSFPQTNIEVAAITEFDGVMYIGGKFTQVEIAATRQRINQPFLAAFDRETGAWQDWFRPTLDGNVWDLAVTPAGQLIVSGQFTNVNGQANTGGLAMLDPTSGQVDPTWRAGLGGGGRPIGRAVSIYGDDLYVGGLFSSIRGTDGVSRSTQNIGKVSLSTGRVDSAFRPNIDGAVFDVAATADRVYAVGNFFYVNNQWSIGETKLFPSNGQVIPGLAPQVRVETRNTRNSYLQAVLPLGDQVWMTGAQHMTQVYRQSDTGILRGWISAPWGDGQALAEINGIVYKSSHANGQTYEYADTFRFSDLAGWTSRKPIRWIGAWDNAARDHLNWYPRIGVSTGEGGWELYADSVDCLWAGGDFNRGSYQGNTPIYVSGFARFCSTDTEPPTTPQLPTAKVPNNGGINLAWNASTDNRPGTVYYEILKNDRVFASYISIQTFRDPDGLPTDRYFVRAIDATGNRSATTRVFTADGTDTTRPTMPADLAGVVEANGDVTLTWSPSDDDFGVEGYIVYRNGVEIQRTIDPTAVIPAPGPGNHYYQVRAFDAAGNESFKTPSTLITIIPPDTTPPRAPLDLAAEVDDAGNVTLTWTEPDDDFGVVDYIVFDTNEVVDTVTDTTITIPTPPAGTHFYQVLARDAAGNESRRTASVDVITTVGDTTPPRTPTDLVGVIEANGDVTLTWTAPTDNVGVTGYFVYRNGVQIDDVAEPTAVVPAPAGGNHWYQVRAYDAAGNESFRTPSTLITIDAGDTTPPRTPTDLAGVIEANGDVTLTWTEPADDVGVTGYIVYRNSVEIQRTVDPTAVIPAPDAGSHWYQVRAFDAAGNESFRTPSTRIDIAGVDTSPPQTPTDLVGVIEANGDVSLTWTASVDDVGVTGYIVFDAGVEIQRVTGTSTVITAPTEGSHWYQVRAFDAAGNESLRTPSTRIDIIGDDTSPPNTPRDLVANLEANGDITLTWTASVDNVGVAGYIVFDTGAEIQRVTDTTAIVVSPAPGPHWFQVRAFDAAGNESFRTPSTQIDI